jgi:rhamnogalacturonyl hydrolase YesR
MVFLELLNSTVTNDKIMNKRILFIVWMCIVLFSVINVQTIAQNQVRFKVKKSNALMGQEYKPITFDGAWCWFSDPRAAYHDGKTFAGYVNSFGDIEIAAYEHSTGLTETKVLHRFLNKDDHANPSLLFLPDGKIMVFYTKHSTCCGGVGPFEMFYRISEKPYDISEWSEEMVTSQNTEGWAAYCYSNPVLLSEEEDKIYLFWRGGNFRPNFSVSSNQGISWSNAKTLINHKAAQKNVRPYMKVTGNGKNKIHFAFTDGHPRDEAFNSIYYMYYRNGKLFKANGEEITSMDNAPVSPEQTHQVYNAKKTDNRAWIWDVAEDDDGNPVIVYAVFPNDSTHLYYYSRWKNNTWITYELVNAGKWFPETPEGQTEPEPHYSGGIVLDHEDPSIIYLSRSINDRFEIEKWQTKSGGKSWKVYPITADSENDNVRPFAVRNAKDDAPLQVLWMNNHKYRYFTDYHTTIRGNVEQMKVSDELSGEAMLSTMKKVADWQLSHPRKHHEMDWHYGAFHTGLMALYKTTRDQKYLDEMISMAASHDYKPVMDFFHADRLTIAQPIIDMYMEMKKPEMIRYFQFAMDAHIKRKPKADVRFEDNPYRGEWWTWCDALYMAPPAFAKMSNATGEQKYLDYADKHWWITSDYLYRPEDSLYFRDDRYFDKKTENGKKVFWSRGNGWVIGGLVHMLEEMPENYASRAKFEKQYIEMAEKIASLQGDDGLWGVSLLDRDQFPVGETSGSAFHTYALAWGINNGYLNREKYQIKVENAWKALVANVQSTGKLGYVQQVAADPYVTKPAHWEVYGTGAFLLAGTEIYKMIHDK